MRARYYEPWTGRFISEDPSQDGVNWYLYADGNPVGKVDFEGNLPVLVLALLKGAVLGALFSIGFQYLIYGNVDWNDVALAAIGGAIGGVFGTFVAGEMGITQSIWQAILTKSRLDIGGRLVAGAWGARVRFGTKKLLGATLSDDVGQRKLNGPIGRLLKAHAGNMFVLDILINILEEGGQGAF